MSKVLFTIAILFISSTLFGQTREKLPCVDKEFSVIAHIFRDTFGNANITETRILDLYDELNVHFEPICISFKVCEFRYHDNFQYDINSKPLDWQEMQTLYHQNNRINVYYVDDIAQPAGCGYTDRGDIAQTTSGGIVIRKGGSCCFLGSKTHPHEFGHYFSLYDTNEGGNELVDGSNCATAGDRICDTPADPSNINPALGDYFDEPNCRFVYKGVDANGDFYNPLVGNVMSEFPDSCGCSFTDEQLRAMANYYLANKGMW